MQIVARKFSHSEFETYLKSLVITPWAKFVVVHNTSVPDIALYKKWESREGKYKNWTPEQWLKNLMSFYANQGWNGGPHLFIPPTPDTILVLNSLAVRGTHTPSWNAFSYGVETVGEFEREPFDDPTRDNLVTALAMLHKRFNLLPDNFLLGVRGLHFHKEDEATTHKTCPGRNIVKASLVVRVLGAMRHDVAPAEIPHTHEVPIAAQEADTSNMNYVELSSIQWFQAALNQWDPSLELVITGVRDTKTVDATKQFQISNNLVADGVAGPVTRAILKKLNA